MKKSIIALAVLAGSFAGVAQADGTTLYGSVRMAYTYDSKGDGDHATSQFANSGSRFGIKGTDDFGNGTSAFYKYENRIGGNLSTNKLMVGVTGGFGTVSLGLQPTVRDSLDGESDPTNQFGPGSQRSAITSANNAAAYISPNMGGFTIAAAVVADGVAYDEDGNAVEGGLGKFKPTGPIAKGTSIPTTLNRHVDAYDLLVKYAANGFYAGLGYQAANLSGYGALAKNLGVSAGYANDQFTAGLLVEQEMRKGKVDPLFVRLGGSYNVSDADKVYASVSHYDPDYKGAKSQLEAALGYEHKFSKQTKVWAEYGYKNKYANGGEASNKIGLGLRTDF